jgi:hypothetical protein
MRKVPVWALSDEEIKKLVKRCYPGPGQRAQAARMVVIVCRYYRLGDTAGKIAGDLQMTLKAVEMVLRRINRTASRPEKPRGRPEKNSEGIQASM